MPTGLSLNNIVPISVNLSTAAAAVRSFGVMLTMGDSNIINGVERYRLYNDIASVAIDFGTMAPEYICALAYFGQSPSPAQLMIGRWLRTATSGFINGGILTSTEQTMTNWTSITDGSFTIGIDGSTQDLLGLDFSGETNLNGVALVITGGLSGATCTWNGNQFVITSASTGVLSLVTYATPQGTGTDISDQTKLSAAFAYVPIPGFAAEQPVDAITALDQISGLWYFSMFSCTTQPTNDQAMAVAAYIEAASPSRVFGWNEMDTRALSSAYTADMMYRLSNADYQHSLSQYSDTSPVSVASLMGRNAVVDFTGNNTTITAKFKQEPGIVGEVLTQAQSDVVDAKRGNVFVAYQNSTFIIEQGVMASTLYIDERQGIDWLSSQIQTNVYNLFYTIGTKIYQTDEGMNQIATAITAACVQGVNNGLLAPGVWNAAPFGNLQTGDTIPGFYIFAPPIATQDSASRAARDSVLFQVGVKLAGAVHRAPMILNINR